MGGARPTVAATYYEKLFGTDTLRLEPWEAKAEATTESVATVIHDHICAAQVAKTDLFEPLIGSAGAYFRPSRIAGDGYRVRAALRFEEFEGYKFPNLAALKDRYPVVPATHSARLRVWRRASVRGYLCWAAAGSGHWPGFMNAFRNLYRAGHVYMVYEGGASRQFAVTDVFNPATAAHVTRFKNIVSNNVRDANLKTVANMSLKTDFIWPWSDRPDYGYPYVSSVDMLDADVYQKYLSDDIMESTWGKFSEGPLYAILAQVVKAGVLRGHLLAEFKNSDKFHLREYQCNRRPSRGAVHKYWSCEKGEDSNAACLTNVQCPEAGCLSSSTAVGTVAVNSTLTETGRSFRHDSMPLWAEGNALGVTWLFTDSDAGTWAHEVGHHRQFEHAATAPGAQYSSRPSGRTDLHDAEVNQVRWPAPHAHTGDERWDFDCQMSYTQGDALCFCGKCLLRNRGWLIQGLGLPWPAGAGAHLVRRSAALRSGLACLGLLVCLAAAAARRWRQRTGCRGRERTGLARLGSTPAADGACAGAAERPQRSLVRLARWRPTLCQRRPGGDGLPDDGAGAAAAAGAAAHPLAWQNGQETLHCLALGIGSQDSPTVVRVSFQASGSTELQASQLPAGESLQRWAASRLDAKEVPGFAVDVASCSAGCVRLAGHAVDADGRVRSSTDLLERSDALQALALAPFAPAVPFVDAIFGPSGEPPRMTFLRLPLDGAAPLLELPVPIPTDAAGRPAVDWTLAPTDSPAPRLIARFGNQIIGKVLTPGGRGFVVAPDAAGASGLRLERLGDVWWAIWLDPQTGVRYARLPGVA